MDRSVLEGDPHAVLEGMLICAYAVGSDEGYMYVRAEYPLAIKRLQIALHQMEERNLLGKNILGTPFSFTLHIKEGAGAFVCGEETALMGSIEGKRGMPRLRPPFPAVRGLWDSPTNINNVETYANVPSIIRMGGAQYAQIGTEKSKGTKVFALAGKIKRGGMIEVPMGISLREIIFDIGGGILGDRKFKAVQMGGPSGGCVPEQLADVLVDYDSLTATGAIMGSGGMVVMDESTCMVDVARYFLTFIQSESCGKCTFCRIGTKRMLEILTRITEGKGEEKDIAELEDLAAKVKVSSLCGLGQTAPNPVLTTLRYFRSEYDDHIRNKRCTAKKCKALIRYDVVTDACTGCMLCAKVCPTKAAHGERKKAHDDRPGHLHPVRAVLRGLPVRRDRDRVRERELSMAAEMFEITLDGKKLLVEPGKTILDVAESQGIRIPTLCHDRRLEPYASCWVCLVQVEKAKGFVPSCSTRVTPGMVITTGSPRGHGGPPHGAGPAPLQPLRGLQGALHPHLPVQHRHPGLPRPGGKREVRRGGGAHPPRQPHARRHRQDLPAPLRAEVPQEPRGGAAQHQRHQALRRGLRGGSRRHDDACRCPRRTAGRSPSSARAPRASPRRGTSPRRACRSRCWSRMEKAGGMLRYGIPDYRLPPAVLDSAISQMLSMGATLQTGVRLGTDVTLEKLRAENDAVVLAIGAWKGRGLRIPGEDHPAVLSGIDFLRDVNAGKPVKVGKTWSRSSAAATRRWMPRAARCAAAPRRSRCTIAAPGRRCPPRMRRSKRRWRKGSTSSTSRPRSPSRRTGAA